MSFAIWVSSTPQVLGLTALWGNRWLGWNIAAVGGGEKRKREVYILAKTFPLL